MRINTIDAQKGYYLQPRKSRNDVSFGLLQAGKEEEIKGLIKPEIGYMWDRIAKTKAFEILLDGTRVYAKKIDNFIENSPLKEKYNRFWNHYKKEANNLENRFKFIGFADALEKLENSTIKTLDNNTSGNINTPRVHGKVEEIMKSVEDGDGYNPFDGYRY